MFSLSPIANEHNNRLNPKDEKFRNDKYLLSKIIYIQYIPSGQNRRKAVCKSVFECRINKNAFFQTVFLPILPTGYPLIRTPKI